MVGYTNNVDCCMYIYHYAEINPNDGNLRVTISNPVVYAPYGTSAMLRCVFTEYSSSLWTFAGWDEVNYICEVCKFWLIRCGYNSFAFLQGPIDPRCDANITRVRGYRSSQQIACPKSTKTLVTLVIDNVTASDSGNYTCYLDDWGIILLREKVTLNAGMS